MTLLFDVRFEHKRAIGRLELYRKKLTDKYVAQALNRTAEFVRTSAVRAIAKELSPLKQKIIRGSLSIKRADKNTLVAIVQASGRKLIPLPLFGARLTKKGVSVRIGGKSYKIPHAFPSKIKGGRGGIRIRASGFRAQILGQQTIDFREKRVSKTGPDFPIAEILAPGIPAKFVEKQIIAVMRKAAKERFAVVLQQQIKRAQDAKAGG